MRFELRALRNRSTVFQGAGCRGAGSNNAAPRSQRCIDSIRSHSRERVVLGMQMDIFQLLGTNRLEGAQAHMECDGLDLNAIASEFGKNLRREVETGSGSGRGTGLACEHGLVAVAIFGTFMAVNVRRQWHVADPVEDSVELRRRRKTESSFAELPGGENLGLEKRLHLAGSVEEQAFARLNLAAGADQSRPVVLRNLLGQQHLDAARGIRRVALGVQPGSGGVETSRKDAAVIEDQQVIRTQNLG